MAKQRHDGSMQVICVSHSDRPFFDVRSSINFLERRFGGDRFSSLPPLASLDDLDAAVPFGGGLSLWGVGGDNSNELVPLAGYAPGYKIQFAAFVGDHLAVLGSDRIELLDSEFKVVKTITGPWIAGGHTLYPAGGNNVWISAAPANAALKVNLRSGKVTERLAMPERYGTGYALSPRDDLREHYIPTDLQPTHINAAFPDGDGLLVTLWIPGSVGRFDKDRRYREIASGFVGCHGARRDQSTGLIYLTDSPAGLIWIVDPENGKIIRRLQVSSDWLHDCCLLDRTTAAVTASDSNELLLVDWQTGAVTARADCSAHGATTMFVNAASASGKWAAVLGKKLAARSAAGPPKVPDLGAEILMDQYNYRAWTPHPDVALRVKGLGEVQSEFPTSYEILLNGRPLPMEPGEYLLAGEIECRSGGVTIGFLNQDDDTWIESLGFDAAIRNKQAIFRIDAPLTGQVVISSNNASKPETVHAVIHAISLRAVQSKKTAVKKARGRKRKKRPPPRPDK